MYFLHERKPSRKQLYLLPPLTPLPPHPSQLPTPFPSQTGTSRPAHGGHCSYFTDSKEVMAPPLSDITDPC